MAREVGGILAAVYGLLLLYQLMQFHAGSDAYAEFLAFAASPFVIVLLAIVFVFVLVHALTWFMLIGKSQPVQLTRKPMSWQKVFGLNVIAWILVSVAVVFLIFGGL